MDIVKRSYYDKPFNTFDIINDFFDTFYKPVVKENKYPTIDILEKDNRYEVDVSIPGVDKNDIKIEIDDDILKISGEKKFKKDVDEKDYKVIETYYGRFERALRIPENIKKDNIVAQYENGILKITLPKIEPQENKKVIEVK